MDGAKWRRVQKRQRKERTAKLKSKCRSEKVELEILATQSIERIATQLKPEFALVAVIGLGIGVEPQYCYAERN